MEFLPDDSSGLLDPITYKKLPRDPTARILLGPQTSLLKIPRLSLLKIFRSSRSQRPFHPDFMVYLNYIPLRVSGKRDSFIKDSVHFVDKLHALPLSPGDLWVLMWFFIHQNGYGADRARISTGHSQIVQTLPNHHLLSMAGWILRTEWWCSIWTVLSVR